MVSIVNDSLPIMWNTLTPSCYAFHILVKHRQYVYRLNRLKYNGTDPNLTCTIYTFICIRDTGQFNCSFLCLFNHRWTCKANTTLKQTNDLVHTVDGRASAHTFSAGSRRKLEINELSCASEVLLGIHLE
jgi:hypothetical protein